MQLAQSEYIRKFTLEITIGPLVPACFIGEYRRGCSSKTIQERVEVSPDGGIEDIGAERIEKGMRYETEVEKQFRRSREGWEQGIGSIPCYTEECVESTLNYNIKGDEVRFKIS